VNDNRCPPIEVSRRIAAPASAIFRILADPNMHTEIDGSGMLRGTGSEGILTGVGDVFMMNMHFSRLGNFQMDNYVVQFDSTARIGWEPVAGRGHPEIGRRIGHRWSYHLTQDGPDATVVTEIYDCSSAPADFRHGMNNGTDWIVSMQATLERLDGVACRR